MKRLCWRNCLFDNIAVIEKASIDLERGFTVLTGETGAGKSIIIDAIHAVLGERTSKELVRTGRGQRLCLAPCSPAWTRTPCPCWTGFPCPGRRTALC